MSPSNEHEQVKKYLGCFLEAIMVELAVDFQPGGSTTFRRRDLRRGLEPDECYWTMHWQAVAGKDATILCAIHLRTWPSRWRSPRPC